MNSIRKSMPKKLGFCVLFVFLLLIAISFSLSHENTDVASAAELDFSGGSGTLEDPYQISTPQDLNNLRYYTGTVSKHLYFVQINHIDMLYYSSFSPIGSVSFPFCANYDGQQYSISNLTINQPLYGNVGLFSALQDGTIKNLKIVNSRIAGYYNVGAIVGSNKGKVIGCTVDATVKAVESAGGVVGINGSGGVIEQCGNKGKVEVSGLYAGGITGINHALIRNSYNIGALAADIYCGGIAGVNYYESANIEQCFNVGSVNGAAVGQIAGDNIRGNILLSRWIYIESFSQAAGFNSGKIDYSIARHESDFASGAAFVGWQNFSEVWMYLPDATYPILKCEYVKVTGIKFSAGDTVKVQQGATYDFLLDVLPIHATNREFVLKVVENAEFCNFDSKLRQITVKQDAPVGLKIRIEAYLEGNQSFIEVEVAKVPVTKVETDNENHISSIKHGESIAFSAEVFPVFATYKDVIFSVTSSFAEIDSDGVLTVSNAAPIGHKFSVICTSIDNPIANAEYEMTVEKEPVTEVVISSPDSFVVSEQFVLTAEVFPSAATYKNVTFKIVSSSAPYAAIVGDTLIASGEGEIVVQAVADGIASAHMTITALKNPVTQIVFSEGVFLCTEGIALQAQAMPQNATYPQISYSISEENNIGAAIVNGILFAQTSGEVLIRAEADGVCVEKIFVATKIDVDSVCFVNDTEFYHNDAMRLRVSVEPSNATNLKVQYEIILDESSESELNGDILKSKRPGFVKIRATVDGVSAEQVIQVKQGADEKIYVTDIKIEEDEFKISGSLELMGKVFPSYATSTLVSFVIIDDGGTDAKIVDETLSAKSVGTIIVEAFTLDGFSKRFEISAHEEPVKDIIMSSKSFKVTGKLLLNAYALPFYATNTHVSYEIVESGDTGAWLEYEEGEFWLSAKAVGSIKIHAIAGEVTKEFEIEVAKEPVEHLLAGHAKEFKISGSLLLSVTAMPVHATYRDVELSIQEDFGIGKYAELVDGVLRAQVEGVIRIKAVSDEGRIESFFDVTAKPEPVTDIVFNMSNKFKVSGSLFLSAQALPTNATYREISYTVLNTEKFPNNANAYLNEEKNVLYAPALSKDKWESYVPSAGNDGKLTVWILAEAVGFSKSLQITVEKEPVQNIEQLKMSFKTSQELDLFTAFKVGPSNASFPQILSFEIDDQTLVYPYEDERVKAVADMGLDLVDGHILKSRFPGIVTIKLVSACDPDREYIFDIEVEEEKVNSIDMKIQLDEKAEYENHLNATVKRGTSINVMRPAYSDTAGFDATYRDLTYQDLYVTLETSEDGKTRTETFLYSDVKNVYFTFDGATGGNKITIKENAPVGHTFTIFFMSVSGEISSNKTTITIFSELFVTVTEDYKFNSSTGELKTGSVYYKGLESFTVKIINKDNYVETTFAADGTNIYFMLYRSLAADRSGFTISVTLNFSEKYGDNNQYTNNYKIPLPKSYYFDGHKFADDKTVVKEYLWGFTPMMEKWMNFPGIVKNEYDTLDVVTKQINDCNKRLEESVDYGNAVVWFDFYSQHSGFNAAEKKSVNSDKIKFLYAYGNPSNEIKDLNFSFNVGNRDIDVVLNGMNFTAPVGQDAIGKSGSGTLRISVVGTNTVRGGAGTAMQIGKSGIYSGGKIEMEYGQNSSEKFVSGAINVYGGKGGIGAEGAQGAWIDPPPVAADAKDGYNGRQGNQGGKGGTGGTGGYAIYCDDSFSSVLTQAELRLKAGNGGTGGTGGKGGQGQTGQKGGHNTVWLAPGKGGNGGRGGKGGTGGNGGRAGTAFRSVGMTGSHTIIENAIQGAGGRGGTGGTGGYEGGGGVGDGWNFGINGSKGKVGAGGTGGDGGIGSTKGAQGTAGVSP